MQAIPVKTAMTHEFKHNCCRMDGLSLLSQQLWPTKTHVARMSPSLIAAGSGDLPKKHLISQLLWPTNHQLARMRTSTTAAGLGDLPVEQLISQQLSLSRLAEGGCLSLRKKWKPQLRQDWDGRLMVFSLATDSPGGADAFSARLKLQRLTSLLWSVCCPSHV